MIKEDYKIKLNNIICESKYEQWENVSDIYVKLYLAKVNQRKIILLWADVPYTQGRREAIKNFFNDIGIENYETIVFDFFDKKTFKSQWFDVKRKYLTDKAGNKDVLLVSYVDLPIDPVNAIKRKFGLTDRRRIIRDIRRNTELLTLSYHNFKGNEIAVFVRDHQENFCRVMESFADDESRDVLLEIVRAGVQNDVYKLPERSMREKYWECYRHLDDEVWLNCGAASGDTICKFLLGGYKYEKILAYEGESSVFKLLENNVNLLPQKDKDKMQLVNSFIGLEGDKGNIDEVFKNKRLTLINMDIEGAEMDVLNGGLQVIKANRPVLAVCAYHKPSDLLDIPGYVNKNLPDYKIYLRKYRTNSPLYLAEYVYYCVPEERVAEA